MLSMFLKLSISEIMGGLAESWRAFKDIIRTACIKGLAQPV